jgi:hypothetical protein
MWLFVIVFRVSAIIVMSRPHLSLAHAPVVSTILVKMNLATAIRTRHHRMTPALMLRDLRFDNSDPSEL